MSLRPLLRCLPLVAIALAAACSERLDTSANCPLLCTDNVAVFKDTTFDIVTFDTTFTGFTGEGERWRAPAIPTSNGSAFVNETYVPVITRTDSVDVRQVFRFDTLPNTFSSADTTKITAVTNSRLLLVVDTARSTIPATSATITLYDVDDSTVTDDTLPALLTARFVPSRLITQRTFTRAEIRADTLAGSGGLGSFRGLSVVIPDSIMLRYIRAKRMRIGVQVTSPGSTALSLVSPTVNAGDLVPRITYDPSPDTAVRPWSIATKYQPTATTSNDRFRSQTLVVRNTSTAFNDGTIEVGGLVGSRTLMTVRIPRRFLDTVTVVRASLDLTQRPQRNAPGARDGVRVRPRIGIAGPVFGGELRRFVELLDPTVEGTPLPSLTIFAADSGVRSFDVLQALRSWQVQDTTQATNFVLYGEGETYQEQRPAFFSRRSSNPAVRPRLRVTYTLRREGAIP